MACRTFHRVSARETNSRGEKKRNLFVNRVQIEKVLTDWIERLIERLIDWCKSPSERGSGGGRRQTWGKRGIKKRFVAEKVCAKQKFSQSCQTIKLRQVEGEREWERMVGREGQRGRQRIKLTVETVNGPGQTPMTLRGAATKTTRAKNFNST